MLKLIPFQGAWATHETLDLHAIYRRPVRDMETGELVRDDHGFIQWDLTTALPVRQHLRWQAKGFEYVTLASIEDVKNAADPERAVDGIEPLRDPRQYLDQNTRNRGPWDAQKYLADAAEARDKRRDSLLSRLSRVGPDEAEAFEQERDPGYVLPDALRTQVTAAPEPKRRGRPRKVDPDPEPEVVTA